MLAFPLFFAAPAAASSLDLIEVGGSWGTPAATNPSALWWNPAGLAVAGGTQFLVEGAPTFAKLRAERYNPDYGEPDPNFVALGYPADYDYGGVDTISFTGVVPFLGISSDFTVPGLGVGVGLYVPIARGGESDQAFGPNRFALREGSIQVVQASLGAAYRFADRVSLGATVSLLDSTYKANVDTTTYPDFAFAVADELGLPAPPASYQDAYIEQDGYTATSHFDLRTQAITFGAGVHVEPLGTPLLGISVAYNHGVRVDNAGSVRLDFACPPDFDGISQFAANDRGTCDVTFDGVGTIGYQLPSRIHLGVVTRPTDALRVEAFGAYVMWSQFTDYDIRTEIDPAEVDVEDPAIAEETAALASQELQWARDNRDSFFVGVDGKLQVHRLVGLGLRATFDRAAVPDRVLSANNLDNDTLILSGLVVASPIPQLDIGLSLGRHVLFARDVDASDYRVTVDPTAPVDPRYAFPSSAGRYSGGITRVGISVRGHVGNKMAKR